MPRFVVLRHEMPPDAARPSHWDFMVECIMVEQDAVLRTWALAEEPTPDRPIAAESLEDHRLAYLDYQGPVSNDRGSVTRWDRGVCTIEETTDQITVIAVQGEKLVGRVEIQIHADESPSAIFTWRRAAPTSRT